MDDPTSFEPRKAYGVIELPAPVVRFEKVNGVQVAVLEGGAWFPLDAIIPENPNG